MRESGIYRLTNTANGRTYYGISENVAAREGDHLARLARGGHENKDLQADYDLHGRSVFVFEPLASCDIQDARWLERELVKRMRPFSPYNLASGRPRKYPRA